MKWAAGIVLITGLWMSVCTSSHAQSNVQFSGYAIQLTPDGKSRQAQIFVGDNRVRLQYRRLELDMVEIYDMENQRVLFLVPLQKIYMQRSLLPGKTGNPVLPSRDSNPCAVMPDGHCKKFGSEDLYGRPVSKWEVTVDQQGKAMRSLHWIDDERLMSLRDVWPDGSVSELALVDLVKLDERTTERWQRTTTRPDGTKDITLLWYDPELKIAVREQLAGGFVREIRRIRVETQPATLFQIPAEYRLVEEGSEKQE